MGRGKKSVANRKSSRKDERLKTKEEKGSKQEKHVSPKGYKGIGRVGRVELDENQEAEILNVISLFFQERQTDTSCNNTTTTASNPSNLSTKSSKHETNKKGLLCHKQYLQMNSHDQKMMIKTLIRNDRVHCILEEKQKEIERKVKYEMNKQYLSTNSKIKNSDGRNPNASLLDQSFGKRSDVEDSNASMNDTITACDLDEDDDDDNSENDDEDDDSTDDNDDNDNDDATDLTDLIPPPVAWSPPPPALTLSKYTHSPRCVNPLISQQLKDKLTQYQANPDLQDLFRARQSLPIYASRQQIVDTINAHPVVIISGMYVS